MSKHTARNWHIWVSVALGLPLLLVGLTTVFIAHEKALGTKEVLLPGAIGEPEPAEIRASASRGGTLFVGTKRGLFLAPAGGEDVGRGGAGREAHPAPGSPDDEIRDLAPLADGWLLAGKKGLWRYEDQRSTQVYRGDCWQLDAQPGGLTAACKDTGLLQSQDGRTWSAMPLALAAVATPREQGTPLSKVIMDIHTGKLFFGKAAEWIWIDLLGLAMVGLSLTGFVMWARSRRTRAAARSVETAAASSAATVSPVAAASPEPDPAPAAPLGMPRPI